MTIERPRQKPATAGLSDTFPALITAMRPRQWTKNLIVFAPLVFALQLDDPGRVLLAVSAFAVFCAASGGVYLVNDLVDREADRLHPRKRHRPIASGRLGERTAVVAAIAALAGAIIVAGAMQLAFALVIVAYVLLMISYSFWIKHLVILDVFAISAGFVLRAAGGAVALDLPISPWLYVCTVLLSLFLGFGKRRNEIRLLEHGASAHRRNLDEYTPGLLDQLIMLTATATIMAYSLYTFTAPNLPSNHSMMLTIPFVLYGVFRYLFLVYSRDEGGAPEQLLLTDRPLQFAVVLWGLAAVLILYTAP